MGPTLATFGDFLIAAGIITELPTDTQFMQAYLDGAMQQLDRDTNWCPFYCTESGDTTMLYDISVPTQTLRLRTGILSLTSFTLGGTVYTEDADFYLRGAVGANPVHPPSEIAFVGTADSGYDRVSIVGKFGFTDVDDAVINFAVMKAAAANYVSSPFVSTTGSSGTGGGILVKEKIVDFERTWANPIVTSSTRKTLYGVSATLYDDYKRDISPYKRKRL